MVQGHRISNVFGTLDEDWHTKVMKPIKGLYSMTRSLDMEPHIDTTVREFFDAIEKRFVGGQNGGEPFDVGDWVPFCKSSMPRPVYLYHDADEVSRMGQHEPIDGWQAIRHAGVRLRCQWLDRYLYQRTALLRCGMFIPYPPNSARS